MKMVTKRFPATWANTRQLEEMVTQKLCALHYFYFYKLESAVYTGNDCRSRCNTPAALYEAWLHDNPISFSITLPAKYWRKP